MAAAAALRTSCRSLKMIARHRFHEGCKETNYEIARMHFKICERSCTRLNSTGDLSVCYWILGELASNKQYYSKATMFYEKAINTYTLARTFSQYQPSLSVIYARYSYALAGKNRLLPQSKPACDEEDEHRPNPQSDPEHLSQPIRSSSVDCSRTPSPTQGTSDKDSDTIESFSIMDCDALWSNSEPCQDRSPTYIVVTGHCQSESSKRETSTKREKAAGCYHSAPEPSHVLQPNKSSSVTESRTPPPTQGTSDINDSGTTESLSTMGDCDSDTQWQNGEPCQDPSPPYIVVTGPYQSESKGEDNLELEKAVEEIGSTNDSIHSVNIQIPGLMEREPICIPSTVQHFPAVHEYQNPWALIP